MATQTMSRPIAIERVDRALGHQGVRVNREYVYHCPFHDDEHPSLRVNAEKEVWHCFPCGKGGHINQLPGMDKRSSAGGVVATTPSQTSNNSLDAGAGMWGGVLSALEAKAVEVKEKLDGCKEEWKTYRCRQCGTMVAFPGRCHHNLCLKCRLELGYVFFRNHGELKEFATLSLVSLQMAPELVEGKADAKEQIDRGRKVIAKAAGELGLVGHIYSVQPRIGNGLSAPVFAVVLPCTSDVREKFLLLWAVAGGRLGPDVSRTSGYPKAIIDRFLEYTAYPFYAETWDDICLCRELITHMKHFQGAGGLYRVSGGALRDNSEKPQRHCPVCGSTDLERWGVIDGENIVRYGDGYIWRNPHWGEDGVKIPKGLDVSLIS